MLFSVGGILLGGDSGDPKVPPSGSNPEVVIMLFFCFSFMFSEFVSYTFMLLYFVSLCVSFCTELNDRKNYHYCAILIKKLHRSFSCHQL